MSSATALTGAARRPKWYYPPVPPTPRILHLLRRPPRRRAPKSVHGARPNSGEAKKDNRGKLEALFDQERAFSRASLPIVLFECDDGESERRRDRVKDGEVDGGDEVAMAEVEEDKWRFQDEMLRAECNLLRMEKEIAVKKMERTKLKMERTLKSAVHTLVSGRKKICEGKNISMILEEEIEHLAEKLEKLQKNLGAELVVGKTRNFDKQAYFLQRQLHKFRRTSDEICVKEIQEMAEASFSMKTSYRVNESSISSAKSNVEILRRKMEGLSNGMLLERMREEYGSMLSTANPSASSSERIEAMNLSSSSIQNFHKEKDCGEENACSGRCKAMVRRIVEQVRAETDQWSQMQEMLVQVKEEMEELHASRDFWEDRALDSDDQIQSLQSAVQEWKQKAVSSESKAKEFQIQVCMVHGELGRLRKEASTRVMKVNDSIVVPRDPQHEMEKRVLICHLKQENHCRKEDCSKQRKPPTAASKRSTFGDIGNSSLLVRQNSKAVFPLPSKT